MFKHIFKNPDIVFKDLGFTKMSENEYRAVYAYPIVTKGFTHVIEITHRTSGYHAISSYNNCMNSDGHHNSVVMSVPETKAAIKKLKQMRRKYHWE